MILEVEDHEGEYGGVLYPWGTCWIFWK